MLRVAAYIFQQPSVHGPQYFSGGSGGSGGGSSRIGASVGLAVGTAVVGFSVGTLGGGLGSAVGDSVGPCVVGASVGASVGLESVTIEPPTQPAEGCGPPASRYAPMPSRKQCPASPTLTLKNAQFSVVRHFMQQSCRQS
jgi:hypothetical protein